MKLKTGLPVFLFFTLAACSVQTTTVTVDNSCQPLATDNLPLGTANVVSVEVGCGYVNEPCVAVKICEPGTANCQTIDHILLDTGSYGLRLFNCNVSLNLPNQLNGSVSTTGNIITSSLYLTHLASIAGISTGLTIAGAGLPSDTTVSSVNGSVTTTGNITTGSNQLTSLGNTSVSTGMPITGAGIPGGTTIAGVSGSTVTMSNAATATTTGVSVTFAATVTMSNAAVATTTGLSVKIGSAVAECVTYADHTGDWGPVMLADVTMAQETAFGIPIQIINPNYNAAPGGCGQTEEYSPVASGFNGILGVGVLTNDCPICESLSDQGYFGCTGSNCSGITAAAGIQVVNPITQLRVGGIPAGALRDTNGSILAINPVGSVSGAINVTGTLTLGIDTVAGASPPGNSSSGMALYQADSSANFNSLFEGTNYSSSFVDSGSNFWDFPTPPAPSSENIPVCGDGLYCPGGLQSLSVQGASAGSFSYGTAVSFSIINADSVVDNGNTCFNNVGAPYGNGFDWGLPFFYNNAIAVGIDSKSSSLGTGPYWGWKP